MTALLLESSIQHAEVAEITVDSSHGQLELSLPCVVS